MIDNAHSTVPPRSHDLDAEYARSRTASTLRLLTLVVATSLVVALIVAGVFAEVLNQLSRASH